MNQPPEAEAWYGLRTQQKSEHLAAAHLRMLDGVDVYCPPLRFRRMTRRGPVWFTEALFPGYLFARFAPWESQRLVVSARGVTAIVRFGDELAAIPDASIADLHAHMGDEDCRTIDAEVRDGDSVTVTDGVFKGLTTVVTQLLPAHERVRILVDFLGECREVEVRKDDLLPQRPHILSAP